MRRSPGGRGSLPPGRPTFSERPTGPRTKADAGRNQIIGPIMAAMTPEGPAGPVRLRAFVEADLPFLDRLCTDPDMLGEFEWPGCTDPRAPRAGVRDGRAGPARGIPLGPHDRAPDRGAHKMTPTSASRKPSNALDSGRKGSCAAGHSWEANTSAYWSTDCSAKTGARRRNPASTSRSRHGYSSLSRL